MIGFPWQAINLASLFLLLGVGIDDAFVMLGSYHRLCSEHPNESKSEIFRKTYEEAAISITITSLTNICSFAIGNVHVSFNNKIVTKIELSFQVQFCLVLTPSLFFVFTLQLGWFMCTCLPCFSLVLFWRIAIRLHGIVIGNVQL